MKNLKVTDYQHDRIKAGSQAEGLPVGSFIDAILQFALTQYESGKLRITAPTPPIADLVTQPEEATA